MPVKALYYPEPFNPYHCRAIDANCVQDVEQAIGGFQFPTIAILNGEPVLRKHWRDRLNSTDTVSLHVLPTGDGDSGGSNPLRAVATLALAYFTLGAGNAWLVGAQGLFAGTAGTLTGALITSGTFAVGSGVLNAVLPKPNIPSSLSGSLESLSPTYTINSRGNRARLMEPQPELFGRHVLYPDLAAQAYSEFIDNEQFLYRVFELSRGEVEVEQIRLADTNIDSFLQVDYQVYGPGEPIDLFPVSVVTSPEVAGQLLLARNEHAIQATSAAPIQFDSTTDRISDGPDSSGWDKFSGHSQIVVGNAGSNSGTYTVAAATSTYVETVEGLNEAPPVVFDDDAIVYTNDLLWTGPFVANDALNNANKLVVEIVFPIGLSATADFQIDARTIDSSGAPTGSWTTLGTPQVTTTNSQQERYTLSYSVSPDRYEVRVARTDNMSNAQTAQWTALRAHLETDQLFPGCSVLAVRMLADQQLSNVNVDQINVIATRKLPIYDAASKSWSAPTATRNIAWAAAYVLRDENGANRSDSDIDLDKLATLAATWEARGDYFDGIFDRAITSDEALKQILRVGRAVHISIGNLITFVRDEAQSVAKYQISSRDMMRGSFSIEHQLFGDDSPDCVNVQYFNSDTWLWDEVCASLPGSAEEAPEQIKLFGCTSRDHAWREGMYMLAAHRYQRQIIRFSTELQGHLPSYGDRITINHNMPDWGQSGEVVAINGLTYTLSEPVDFSAGGIHYISFTKPDGSKEPEIAVSQGEDELTVVLAQAPGFTPNTSDAMRRTRYVLGAENNVGQDCVLTGAIPRGQNQVELILVNYSDALHTADQGSPPPA